MADNFNRDHEPRQVPHRTREVRQVFPDALLPDTHVVVIQKDGNSDATGDRWGHGRRFEAWDDPDQIHQKYEDEHRADKWEIFTGPMFQRIVRLARQEVV